LRKQRCENCAFVNPPAKNGQFGTCHLNPPTATLAMIGTNTKGEPVMQPIGIFPPVGPQDYCHRWKVRIAGMMQAAGNDEGAAPALSGGA
jgi:hypothetical protein